MNDDTHCRLRWSNADGGGEIELGTVEVIPPGGTLLFRLPVETPDMDLEIIKEQIRRHFGGQRAVVIRAGDLEIVHIGEE